MPVKEEVYFSHTNINTKTIKTNNKGEYESFHCSDPNHWTHKCLKMSEKFLCQWTRRPNISKATPPQDLPGQLLHVQSDVKWRYNHRREGRKQLTVWKLKRRDYIHQQEGMTWFHWMLAQQIRDCKYLQHTKTWRSGVLHHLQHPGRALNCPHQGQGSPI